MIKVEQIKKDAAKIVAHILAVIGFYSEILEDQEKKMLSIWSFCFFGGLAAIAHPAITYKPLIAFFGFLVGFSLVVMIEILAYQE